MKQIEQILKKINSKDLNKNTAAVGFDGYIDKIFRLVKRKFAYRDEYFEDIRQFAEYLLTKPKFSHDIEISFQSLRPGGNVPLMANSLGMLGLSTVCFTTNEGYEELFRNVLSKNCDIFTIGKAAHTISLEFEYGKIMLGDNHTFKDINWTHLQKVITKQYQERMYNADLLALLNWSHMPAMTEIWKGILSSIHNYPRSCRAMLFIDLADPSSREDEDIKAAFKVIREFRKYYYVILGMNKNETSNIIDKMHLEKNSSDMVKEIHSLIDEEYVDELVIHLPSSIYSINKNCNSFIETTIIKNSIVSTGAGDNFSGGYCWGRINGMDICESSIIGIVVAQNYIKKGVSLSLVELKEAICQSDDKIVIQKIIFNKE